MHPIFFLSVFATIGSFANGRNDFGRNVHYLNPRVKRQAKCSLSAAPPEPSSGCCGRHASEAQKILIPQPLIDRYPWLALIEYEDGNRTMTLCGGALISSRYVLTAAQCFSKMALTAGTPRNVRLGEYDIRTEGPDCIDNAGSTDCTDGAVRIEIEKTIVHPDYNVRRRQKNHDIALIRLKEMAPYTDFIRPICLPSSDVTVTPPSPFNLYESGWRLLTNEKSDVKLDEVLSYVNKTECQTLYVSVRFNHLCAARKGKDSCTSVGGGPLMYSTNEVFETIGVLSFGSGACGTSNKPDVYTKVFEYKDWIMRNIQA